MGVPFAMSTSASLRAVMTLLRLLIFPSSAMVSRALPAGCLASKNIHFGSTPEETG